MGKGAVPDVRLPFSMRQIGQFIHIAGKIAQFGEIRVGNAVDAHFKLQCRDHGAEIGIAASFAVAVDRAVDLERAETYCSERIGDGDFRVVMSMNAERRLDLLLTAVMIFSTSCGSVPPFVSHSTRQSAPAASAASRVWIA